jgi:chemotaxis regulatin CheY-phosphate phosphatase CheZ
MDRDKQVEVNLTLGQGDFSLRLNGLIMNVRLKDSKGGQLTPHLEVRPILPAAGGARESEAALPAPSRDDPTDTAQLAEEVAYYRQTSQEIYEGLGKLAKEINLSIQDLSLAEIIQSGMISPGERLDQVRSQVADVLEMTEKATLNILNLVEHIQEDCLKVQGHLLHMANGNGGPQEGGEKEADAGEQQETQALCSRLLSQGEALDRQLREHFQHTLPSLAEAPPQVHLTDILQILLEFCGTEAVKPHLKSVQAQHETLFQVEEAERALTHLAGELPQEDGFYQFPVDKVLEILKETCNDERMKELFTKLLASAAKIFPIATLPLEGQPLESASEAGPQSEVIRLWQEFFQNFQQVVRNPHNGSSCPDVSGAEEGLREAAREALASVEHIHETLSRITEALAFQDLSGQRLLKVLKILRQLQVQVLTLLVAAGNKLKVRIEDKEITFTESEISAQKELDRMLHNFTQTSEDPAGLARVVAEQQPLDQEAINELLTSMGF